MTSFITGSVAYGVPNEGSDIDLVIRISEEDGRRLRATLGGECVVQEEVNGYPSISVKIGKLNLIMCLTEESFVGWRFGTDVLKHMVKLRSKPMRREQAVSVFSKIRNLDSGLVDCLLGTSDVF